MIIYQICLHLPFQHSSLTLRICQLIYWYFVCFRCLKKELQPYHTVSIFGFTILISPPRQPKVRLMDPKSCEGKLVCKSVETCNCQFIIYCTSHRIVATGQNFVLLTHPKLSTDTHSFAVLGTHQGQWMPCWCGKRRHVCRQLWVWWWDTFLMCGSVRSVVRSFIIHSQVLHCSSL